MLKIACILAVYVALYYGSLGHEFGYANYRPAPLYKVAELMKRPGLLMYRIHYYDVRVDKTLADCIKRVTWSGQSGSFTSEDVDKVFVMLDKQAIKNMTIYVIEFAAKGDDLFTYDNSKWKWISNERELRPGYFEESPRLVLESEKDKFSFEFNLGPKFSEAEDIGTTFMTKYHLQKGIRYALSQPSVQTTLRGDDQKFEYRIFLHPIAENSRFLMPRTLEEEGVARIAYNLIQALTEKMVFNIANLDTENDFDVDYFYKAETAMIQFDDKNILNFIRGWVTPARRNYVEVDIYGIVKAFLKNPEALAKYFKISDIPHDIRKRGVPGKGDRILYMDKFPVSTKFRQTRQLLKANFKPNDAAGKFMIGALKSRTQQMLDRVKDRGLIESDFPFWQEWIEKSIDKDFKKYLDLTGERRGSPFLVADRNFNAHQKESLKPYEREFKPPYGIAVELNNRNIPMYVRRRLY